MVNLSRSSALGGHAALYAAQHARSDRVAPTKLRHDTPNGGNHSVVAPLYSLRNKTTGETVQVTDSGRAMIDGKWPHIGRFEGPMLRAPGPLLP